MGNWVGVKKVAFVPVIHPNYDLPNSPQGAAWQQLILARIYSWPDAVRNLDVSLRNYIRTVSGGVADIQGEVRDFVTANIQDVPPSYFSSQLEPTLRNEGFDAAALVMNGGVGAGTSDQNGYWARFAMVEGVGVWAMELTHILCKYMDLYTNDKPNDLGSFDNMDCACGTHPTAYTKVQLGWLPPSAIVVAPPATSQYDLHSVGLAHRRAVPTRIAKTITPVPALT